MLKIKSFIFNWFSENTYVVWDEVSKEGIIFDPGCSNIEEEKILVQFIEENKINVKYLINTHCHIDHILGNAFIAEKYNVDLFIPKNDEPLLLHSNEQGRAFNIDVKEFTNSFFFVDDNENFLLGDEKLIPIFTPGHTPGEFCFYNEANKILISGDVLFRESIGRTDLWGGNYEQLIDSINQKILCLPDETKVYPGHGELTSVGWEKMNNPFFKT